MSGINRKMGLGGTDIAAIVGLSDHKSAFDVYCNKTGLMDDVIVATNERVEWGTRLQQVIAQAYAEKTNRNVNWVDETMVGNYPWQLWTPDVLCKDEPRGVDCKTAGLDQLSKWGDPGTDEVPDQYALQAHWYLNASGLMVWDLAVLVAGSDFRIYTINRDEELEGMLLEQGERFWKDHVLAGVPPTIEATERAAEFLRSRYPRNNGTLREPTEEEMAILNLYRPAREKLAKLQAEKDSLEMRLKLSIGDCDGLLWAAGKEHFTYKKAKDSQYVNWESIALPLLTKLPADEAKALLELHTRTKQGSRRIHVKFANEKGE